MQLASLTTTFCLALSLAAVPQSGPTHYASQLASTQLVQPQREPPMTKHAVGTFEVKITPLMPDNKPAETANIGRMLIDKQFKGDLEATGTGEMLAAMTEVKGSAGYVAMERVNGTVHGRKGTFVLQHTATMTRGVPQMSVTVVPDSATGALAGLSGSMNIIIEGGKHSYKFDYTLPQSQE
jgi:Protein of unknown function (DUF3224)